MAKPIRRVVRKSAPRSRRRYLAPRRLVHVGSRTIRGQYFLSPAGKPKNFYKRCVGFMAVAAKRYGVSVVAVVIMSNHLHCILRAGRARSISLFMQYTKASMTRLVHRTHGITGRVWGEPFSSTNLLDDEAEQHWLRYLISHGTKEGLVSRPGDWPGLHCVDALQAGRPLDGLVLDSKGWKAARRKDPHASIEDHLHPVALPLDRPESWTRGKADYREWCTRTAAEIVAEHADMPMAGLEAIFARPFTYVPETVKQSVCRCFDARGPHAKALLKEAMEARRATHEAADEAHEKLIEQAFDVGGIYLHPAMQWSPEIARLIGDPVCCPDPGPTQRPLGEAAA